MGILGDDTHRIGRVAAIESERLQIELDVAASGLVKAGTSGVIPVGSINSYVTIDVGPQRIVAVVTAIRMSATPQVSEDVYDIGDSVNRMLEATMVGRIEGGRFVGGISTYPSLFAAVSAATRTELVAIFRPGDGPVIALGEAVVAPDQKVTLDVNRLLSRHCAVLGTTGSGKSCSVTAIIDGILSHDVPYANIVILDANGEYSAAFEESAERASRANVCVIGPEPGPASLLTVPHWFMNSDEHITLLRAAEGVQAPILQRAIADARLGGGGSTMRMQLLVVRRSIEIIRSMDGGASRKPQPAMSRQFEALAATVADFAEQSRIEGEEVSVHVWESIADELSEFASLELETHEDRSWDAALTSSQRLVFRQILDAVELSITEAMGAMGLGSASASSDFDAPSYYELQQLADIYLPQRIELEAAREPRVTNYMATLSLRLSRLLADERYDFLTRVQHHDSPLARFLRLLLGFDPLAASLGGAPPWEAAYKERVSESPTNHTVTIVDLSLVAFDVLGSVASLLARLLFDFVQRIEPRGCFPILLVLEEAHRYVPNQSAPAELPVTFERIAKEGRKFGLSLLLASQRPSELSETVLAQCGTLVAHRIVSESDQELVRHATPYAARDILRQLPGLATQHAVVLGESIAAPALVRIRSVEPVPYSKDPDFIEGWRSGPPGDAGALIDDVANRWEKGDRSRSHSVARAAERRSGLG